MSYRQRQAGFTLLEILVVIAIIAVIAAIAIPVYRNYLIRAHSAEIIEDFEAVRESVALNYDGTGTCGDLVNKIDPKFLKNKYAHLDIGFEPAQGGFAPFFRVCAEYSKNGKMGVEVAAAAHKVFVNIDEMDKGAVLGASLVSFAVPLAPPDTTVCGKYTPPAGTGSGCGGSGGLKPQVVAAAPAPAVPPPPPPPPPKQPDNVTSTGIKCKDWEYADGANCKLKPEYSHLTITAKPTMANNPCPPGYHFQPADGQAFSGSAQKGTCETSGNHPNPYEPVTCEVCSGPTYTCERLHHSTQCVYPNNYCVNKLTNLDMGARYLERRCGSREEATREWYQGSSGDDRCKTFDNKFVQTLSFECFYACVTDKCNEGVNPIIANKDSMWKP